MTTPTFVQLAEFAEAGKSWMSDDGRMKVSTSVRNDGTSLVRYSGLTVAAYDLQCGVWVVHDERLGFGFTDCLDTMGRQYSIVGAMRFWDVVNLGYTHFIADKLLGSKA